jgi:hypothetical protein
LFTGLQHVIAIVARSVSWSNGSFGRRRARGGLHPVASIGGIPTVGLRPKLHALRNQLHAPRR